MLSSLGKLAPASWSAFTSRCERAARDIALEHQMDALTRPTPDLAPGPSSNPTAERTARQITEAFPCDAAPRSMIRDRDSIYGDVFRGCV